MKFVSENLKWTREPKEYSIDDNQICIVTEPHTDLWQRTYYHFQNDNAPVLQMTTSEQFFSFVVKTNFEESHQRFDQCGIVMYLDSENWLKASIEYENENFQHLGSVVTNHGYSDWATTEIPSNTKSMWYRFSRREDDYCIECSEDGIKFKQMRVCHMHEGKDEIRFGIYACSPENSSFKAVFSEMQITECMWKAHDGQQPDLPKTIARIQQMEEFLDEILDALSSCPESIKTSAHLQEILKILEDYYENGQWLSDYLKDDRGEIPKDLKRGVLAQDTLWNLFSDIKELGASHV